MVKSLEQKDLEKIIEERKKQAVDRKLVDKIDTIVLNLGKTGAKTDGEYEGHFLFNYKELRIAYCGVSLVYIMEGDKERLVFYGYKDEDDDDPELPLKDVIEAYIPGEWEKYLPHLYRKAVAEGRKKEREEFRKIERESIDDIRTRWGI